MDGGTAVASLMTSPTALLHDPWMNALWFFDGPVLRALQLSNPRRDSTHRLVRVSYLQTMMRNNSGGFVFHDPISAYKPRKIDWRSATYAAFAIEDGPVGLNSTGFPEFKSSTIASAVIAGKVMPYSGHSMGTCPILMLFLPTQV